MKRQHQGNNRRFWDILLLTIPTLCLWTTAILICYFELKPTSIIVPLNLSLSVVITILGIIFAGLTWFTKLWISKAINLLTWVELSKNGVTLKDLDNRLSTAGAQVGAGKAGIMSAILIGFTQLISITYKNTLAVYPSYSAITFNTQIPTAGSAGSDITGPLYHNARSHAANLSEFISLLQVGKPMNGSGFLSAWKMDFNGTGTNLEISFLDTFDVSSLRDKGYKSLIGSFPGQTVKHSCDIASSPPSELNGFLIRSGYAVKRESTFVYTQYVLENTIMCKTSLDPVMFRAEVNLSGPVVTIEKILSSSPRAENILYTGNTDLANSLFSTVEQMIFFGVNDQNLRSPTTVWSESIAKVRLAQRVALVPFLSDQSKSIQNGGNAAIESYQIRTGTRIDFTPTIATHVLFTGLLISAIASTITIFFTRRIQPATFASILKRAMPLNTQKDIILTAEINDFVRNDEVRFYVQKV